MSQDVSSALFFSDNKLRLKKVKSFGYDYTTSPGGLRVQTWACLIPESMLLRHVRADMVFVFNS